ncbi:hypothetical protein [Polycladomyces zharkentensis]|uniref:hypothetical protein n=1 Tax=Polycladomyces zharkentensis TaxID=2807616 RepID=UPI00265ED698|nr:hypothetical protein [Polycladomyces sp. WAk]
MEEKGWVPVDMTMANTLKRGPWRYITGLFQTLTPNQYFGKLEDQRVIFSVETDLEPDPTYPTHVLHDPASISKKEILRIAKRDLYWGRELLD